MRRLNPPVLFLHVVFWMLLASCRLLQPSVNPGEVLFQDDFARNDSGWDRYSDETYSASYIDGVYTIDVTGENILVWSRPHLRFDDVLIRVEGLRISGPLDNVYGVMCRYVDAENFYFFLVSSDGYSGIGRFESARKELLNHSTMLPAEAIGPADEINLIQAACVGTDLRLWVNGELVAEATAPALALGDVGLIVGSYDEGGVSIQFDNFSTLMP